MPYRITFDLPNLSKGQGVAITGLGEFENGKSYEISDEQHDQFRTLTSRQVDETDDKGNLTGRVVTERGSTLKQARFQEGITVEVIKDNVPPEGESEPTSVAPAEKDVPGVNDKDAKPADTVMNDGPIAKGSAH